MQKLLCAVLGLIFVASMLNPAWAQKRKTKVASSAPVPELVSPNGRWAEFAAGQKRRVHLWHEDGVWHFRCTCGVNATVFDGAAGSGH